MDKELKEALIYRLEFILKVFNYSDYNLTKSELEDLIREIEIGEVTPF